MILLMPIALLLTYWVMRLTGVASPEPSTALAEVPILVVAYFIAAVGEEAGWTGYAVGPMQGRWSALGTGLIIGSIWGVWHRPVRPSPPPRSLGDRTDSRRPVAGPHRLALQQHREKHVRRHRPPRDDQRERVHLPGLQFRFAPAVLTVILAIAAVIVTLLWGSRTLARFSLGRSTSRRSQPSGRSSSRRRG